MKIALTGATGHLGYVLHRQLLAHQIDHRILMRHQENFIQHPDFVIGSLGEEAAIKNFVKDCSVVVHVAGIVWPKKGSNKNVQQVNFEYSKQLYELARQAGMKHFVYISSIHSMIVPPLQNVFDETAALEQDQKLAYNYSKACMERYLLTQNDIKITIINPTAVIGPGDTYVNGMNQLFLRAIQNKLPMITAGGYNIVDVRTVTEAIVQAVLREKTGKYIVGDQYYKMTDLAQEFGVVNGIKVTNKVLGSRSMKVLAAMVRPFETLVKKPIPINSYAVETLLEGHQNISSEKAKRALGLTPIPIEKTLKDIYVWFTENKLIV
ncbi:MAG: NAD-dependent epimerase/dehydratase family protein [Gelidibacter sp.]|nr:NAD-dependent epimerase/dehydratase family protein [Gelidibacter sp.]